MIAATTPAGSLTISELPTSSSQVISLTRSGIEENVTVGSPAWISPDRPIGIPSSIVMSAAMSSPRSASFAPMAPHSRARSSAGVCDQESNAARAARTARSASSALPSGTRPMTSSVVGFTTSMIPSPVGSTHSPPMKSLSRTRASDAMAMPQRYALARAERRPRPGPHTLRERTTGIEGWVGRFSLPFRQGKRPTPERPMLGAGLRYVSISSVTGPSLTSDTAIRAPKTPPSAPRAVRTRS